ncbi:MAG: HAD-IG family 5'-nucleotidase, partial [Planctomycetota bacterium]
MKRSNSEFRSSQAFPPAVPPGRGIYCNRTLNLRAIQAIGYDMDYTLVHYNVEEWERCAYEFLRSKLVEQGWPVGDLSFEPDFVVRGLVIDKQLGNIVKANRFGYIKRATHGRRLLEHDEQRNIYDRVFVDLSENRWKFLNTFFSQSAACMYAQLVELLDAGRLPELLGYPQLQERVAMSLDEAHIKGELKARILEEPHRFVVLDEQAPQALLDQKEAGKKLLLITNSEWTYTRHLMEYAFDPFLPGPMTWRELFDVIVVAARKPAFFNEHQPIFRVVDNSGLLEPVVGRIRCSGEAYLGGNAALIEESLGMEGSDILYVGDHIYTDVHVSKGVRRWRTAVMVREIEDELVAFGDFAPRQRQLDAYMAQKAALEFEHCQWRLELQRRKMKHPSSSSMYTHSIHGKLKALRARLSTLDES